MESGVMNSWTNLKPLTQLTALDLSWCNAKCAQTMRLPKTSHACAFLRVWLTVHCTGAGIRPLWAI